jgi:thiol-disulfide isomerase/thioredoxin
MKKIAVAGLSLLVLIVASCKRSEQPVSRTHGFGTDTQTTASAATATAPGTGVPLGEYTALNLDGSKFDIAAKRDKVVLLNVWATWCGPCRFEIPELQKLHESYANRGVEVIGVSVDESGADSVKSFVAEQSKMTYPIVLDAEGKIANMLQTSVLPTTILVDRKGNIVWKKYGAIESGDTTLTKAIEAAL